MKHRFDRLILEPNTPCHHDFFPGYFSRRLSFQVSQIDRYAELYVSSYTLPDSRSRSE